MPPTHDTPVSRAVPHSVPNPVRSNHGHRCCPPSWARRLLCVCFKASLLTYMRMAVSSSSLGESNQKVWSTSRFSRQWCVKPARPGLTINRLQEGQRTPRPQIPGPERTLIDGSSPDSVGLSWLLGLHLPTHSLLHMALCLGVQRYQECRALHTVMPVSSMPTPINPVQACGMLGVPARIGTIHPVIKDCLAGRPGLTPFIKSGQMQREPFIYKCRRTRRTGTKQATVFWTAKSLTGT